MATLEDFVGIVGEENVQNVREAIKTIVKPIIDAAPRERHGINGDYLLKIGLARIRSKHPTVVANYGKHVYGLVLEALTDVMRESGYEPKTPEKHKFQTKLYLLQYWRGDT